MEPSILLDAFNMKPAAAMEYLARKNNVESWNWLDLWKDAHARSFTVAKTAKLDVLNDIRALVDKALANGITFAQFQKELKPQLQKKGWWGKKERVNEETGEITEYMAGSPRRLKTIYQTNLQTAYMAGRYKGQMDAAADLPYIQYIAVMDGRTTDTCRDMHGRVFRADDPIWNSLYPPNHWGCRARTRSLTERMVQREGLKVESSDGRIVTQEVTVGKGDKARKETVTGLKLANGNTFWAGPGWDYNPGTESWMPDLSKYNPDDARAFVTENFRGPAYKFFVESMGKIAGEIPIAVLPKEYMENIGAQTNIVRLSSDTLKKNAEHHPEITVQDYLNLQTIIEKAGVIVQDGPNTMVFIKIGDTFYHAAIKATQTGKGLFMTSLRMTDEKGIAQAMARGRVIKK
jgi:SPP1 gp7 family putative phage head morphogenesis protein